MAKTREEPVTPTPEPDTRSPVEKLRERARTELGLDDGFDPESDRSAGQADRTETATQPRQDAATMDRDGTSDPAGGTAPEEAGETAGAPAAGGTRNWQIAPSSVNFEDPLLSCLSIVAGLIHKPISEQALKAGLPHADGRFTPELAMEAAQRAGLGARLVSRPKVAAIQPLTLPCILLLKGGGACVLLDFPTAGMAEIVSPEGGGNKGGDARGTARALQRLRHLRARRVQVRQPLLEHRAKPEANLVLGHARAVLADLPACRHRLDHDQTCSRSPVRCSS